MTAPNPISRLMRRGTPTVEETVEQGPSPAQQAKDRLAYAIHGREPVAEHKPASAPQTISAPIQRTTGARPARNSNEASMTTQTQTTEKKPTPAAAQVTMSTFSPSMKLRGLELDTEEDLTVHGSIEGKIRVRELIVARGATVSGEIQAEFAKVFGTLVGDIQVKTLMVADGAALVGNVKSNKLGIQPGATVKASIDCDNMQQMTEDLPEPVEMPAVSERSSEMGDFGNIVRLDRASA